MKIKIRNIGPIISLDGDLHDSRNLIFAINGTGKSFLTRSFEAIQRFKDSTEIDQDTVDELLSEEHRNESAEIELIDECSHRVASLEICGRTNKLTANSEKIFHVFSSDYIERELFFNDFKLDGNISHNVTIATIGAENKKLAKLKQDQDSAAKDRDYKKEKLEREFESKKDELQKKFSIRRNLGAFQALSVNYNQIKTQAPSRDIEMQGLLESYKKLQDFPDEPDFPRMIPTQFEEFHGESILEDLINPITLANYADSFRKFASENKNFVESGLTLFHQNPTECPFCKTPKKKDNLTIIDDYIVYVNDEESKVKSRLNSYVEVVERIIKRLETIENDFYRQKQKYNHLAEFFPSLDVIKDENDGFVNEKLFKASKSLQDRINQKIDDLRTPVNASQELSSFKHEYSKAKNKTDSLLENFKTSIQSLQKLSDDSRKERINIQNQACSLIKEHFHSSNFSEINSVVDLQNQILKLNEDIRVEEEAQANKKPARDLVAGTFEELISHVFGDYYKFDSDSFALMRNQSEIRRKPSQTFSDGEKRIIAFCYYLAQTHLKVSSENDYADLIYIIDDPVSSVSFNHIYDVVEVIKRFRYSQNNKSVGLHANTTKKIHMLLLTHNDYLFNICVANNIFKNEGVYQLSKETYKHALVNQKNIRPLYDEHLEHVYKTAELATQPTFYTANSVRFVLEGVMKFCEPNCKNLEDFIGKVKSEHGDLVKSVMINNLSHSNNQPSNTYIDKQIVEACKDVVKIVTYYAKGQIDKLES